MSSRVSETHPRNNREFTPMDLRQSRRDFGMQTIASSLAAGLTLGSIAACGFPLGSLAIGDEPPNPNSLGNGQIQGNVHSRRLIITTTSRVAGAVDSVRYQGVEFIDSHDHGRQMQSAASFDCSRDDPFWPERFNPTEAGSRSDGLGMLAIGRSIHWMNGPGGATLPSGVFYRGAIPCTWGVDARCKWHGIFAYRLWAFSLC
ncbi:MAG: hypothetical protein KGQ51_15960 [Planctomycetes bacterium]|nr:hypothetical protein [Planctomycetota bacterium]